MQLNELHLTPKRRQHPHIPMFGAFRPTNALSGGLLWKIPWRLSRFQKSRQRQRLRAVDAVVATIDQALAKKGETLKALDVWKETMPTEAEMLPKDKYTMFDRKEKRYRKGIHKLPKWTRVSQRLNPPGY
ncbi:mitochondrial 54S ribosomal protein YmL31 [Hypoxylon argillaceum]|nr:mitochondrial 54S ribosomal protein YmL31 [Hypoxylon argillaceum]KAI1155994.1 mitochondrial 54S ribosomal protein YmL31 [Nemania diffusa]